jgi:hypothetical protein
LSKGGRVVGAVAGHRNELASRLFALELRRVKCINVSVFQASR